MDKPHSNKITDLRYLISLSDGNEAFVKEMIQTFVIENPKEVKGLEQGIVQNDFELIRLNAHKMKSTIPFVGIDILIGEEINEIERLAKERSEIQKIQTLFSKVKTVCDKAAIELLN
jgi:HPt (histidine-containing phosphotransfer) domain-containing protein